MANIKHKEETVSGLKKALAKQVEEKKRLEKELRDAKLNLAKVMGIDELKKLDKRLASILGSRHKTPYEKKIALFELVKDLDVGESQPLKEQRVNYLLESRLYDVLAKRALEDYRKTTVKAFSKAKTL